MRRLSLIVLALALAVSACSGEPGDAEVLGVVLERSPSPSPSPEPLETPAARYPEPATAVHPAAEEPVAPPRPPAQQPPSRAEPQPDPDPSPTITTWVVPDGHAGEGGTTWSVTDDCGAETSPCWIETSSTQLEPGQVPAKNPLRVSLASVDDPDAAEREAVCTGGLHADDEVAIEAHGTMHVSLLVDGQVVATSRTAVDVVIAPGSGIAAAELAGPVTVSVEDVSQVTCSVRFSR